MIFEEFFSNFGCEHSKTHQKPIGHKTNLFEKRLHFNFIPTGLSHTKIASIRNRSYYLHAVMGYQREIYETSEIIFTKIENSEEET
jgi:hypothetical protein